MSSVAADDFDDVAARGVAARRAPTPRLEGALQRPAKKARTNQFISSNTLTRLVGSYHKYFTEYSRTKKKVLQRVPAKVWKQVYADYLQDVQRACKVDEAEFEEQSLPAERTLQDALRAALDPDTGASDLSGAEKVAPPSEDVLMRLKKSGEHSKRVLPRHRDEIIAGAIPAASTVEGVAVRAVDHEVEASSEDDSEREDQETSSDQVVNGSSIVPPTGAQISAGRRASASRNATALENMADAITSFVHFATATGATLQSIAKTLEAREQSRSISEKIALRRAKLEEIKWLYDNQVISREVFNAKVSPLSNEILLMTGDE
jgi:hypothetical protein